MKQPKEITVLQKNPDDDNVAIKCPSCGFSKSFPVQKLQVLKHVINVNCKCGKGFSVKLEFRKKFRKKTNLNGLYCDLKEAGSDKWKAFFHDLTRTNCTIVDMSVSGIGVVSNVPHTVSQGDKLRVRFELDISNSPRIELDIIVRYVKDNFIGCEFSDSEKHNKKIGFYLL